MDMACAIVSCRFPDWDRLVRLCSKGFNMSLVDAIWHFTLPGHSKYAGDPNRMSSWIEMH